MQGTAHLVHYICKYLHVARLSLTVRHRAIHKIHSFTCSFSHST